MAYDRLHSLCAASARSRFAPAVRGQGDLSDDRADVTMAVGTIAHRDGAPSETGRRRERRLPAWRVQRPALAHRPWGRTSSSSLYAAAAGPGAYRITCT